MLDHELTTFLRAAGATNRRAGFFGWREPHQPALQQLTYTLIVFATTVVLSLSPGPELSVLENEWPGFVALTVHWLNGAFPTLCTMTVYPRASSALIASCADSPPDGAAPTGDANPILTTARPAASIVATVTFPISASSAYTDETFPN
ncbi:hypothetical protein H7H51_20070 [Mycolicibacterium farcinogenes]|nr:hypothetical protein [Mycolicibacterium farcinogenes]